MFIRIILIILLNLSFMNLALSQVSVYTKFDRGSYTSHTENKLRIMEHNNIKDSFGISLGTEITIYKNYKIQLETGYIKSSAKEPITITTYSQNDGTQSSQRINIYYMSFPIDLSLIPYSNSWLSVGLGPSLAMTNRSLEIEYPESYGGKFEDKINTLGFGYNIFINFSLKPFRDLEKLRIILNIKMRKINSIWISKDGRTLDNYSFDFTQRFFSLGFRWNFL